MQVHEIVSNSRESLDIVLNIEKWVLPGRRTRNRVWCRWGCFYVLWVVVKWKSFRCVWLFVTPWTVTCQAPQSRAFPTQEYWSGLPCPSLGDLRNQGLNLVLLQCRWFLYHLSHEGSSLVMLIIFSQAYEVVLLSKHFELKIVKGLQVQKES